jgi:hypothetical protein
LNQGTGNFSAASGIDISFRVLILDMTKNTERIGFAEPKPKDPAMQESVRILLKSKRFLNWKAEQRFFDKSGLRPEDLNPKFSALSEHFTPQQLADAWGVSTETIRQIFRDEPGVLALGKPNPKKRAYTTLRIPAEVAERVHRRLLIR